MLSPGRLGPSESPIVARTEQKRHAVQSSRSALYWALINVVLALVMYLEISFGSIVRYFNISRHPVLSYAEYGLAATFTLSSVYDMFKYLCSLYDVPVEVTAAQKMLLGVKDSEPGFRMVTPKWRASQMSAGLVISPSPASYSPHSSFLASPPGTYASGGGTSQIYSPSGPVFSLGQFTPPGGSSLYSRTPSPSSRTPSPLHAGMVVGGYGVTHSPPSAAGSFAHGSSFLEQSQSFGASQHSSFSGPSFTRSGTTSPGSPGYSGLSPLFRETSLDTSGLRNRRHNVSAKSSPLRSEDMITDLKSLDEYVRQQEDKDYRMQLGRNDSTSPGSQSFWNYNRSYADYSSILRKYQYQVACRTPRSQQSDKSHDNDPDDPASYRPNEVWHRLSVQPQQLDSWIENLRKWLGQTIMVRVVQEINTINTKLARLGSEELQIGDVSISMLKQMGVTKQQHLPTLNALVPYLEVSTHQEYVIKRIKELGSGGCMSDFKWNGGARFKGKAWEEHLPTDSAIVMHMLCTYMDSHLPPHPKYPDGKTFTSQHLVRSPDKPDIKKPNNLLLYQSKIHPPHYKVVIGHDTWDLRKGRNNLFSAVLLFLHHIQTKENGMLGRVNLGPSGINILWVLNQDC